MRKVLDEYVIGQDEAKRALSVAVFNHYHRVRANLQQTADKNPGTRRGPPRGRWHGDR